ncbi:MAG TPA: protein kinase [Polyangiales bacterium]|nr:protein kinase [Polyangiales bacterium]
MTSPVSTLKGEKVQIDTESFSYPREGGGAATPDVSARFEVQRLLGQGGMGSVFVAQDRGLRRVVALKRLREGLEKSPSLLRRFVLEAQIGAQLEHPNIVPLYSFEQSEGGSPAIAMQLLEGTTMGAYILAAAAAPQDARSIHGEYSLKERVGLLLGVCEAIHFAHERGVIHRDLKPDNVMLGRYREVYVMDWGLARVEGSSIESNKDQLAASETDSSSPGFEDWSLAAPRATRQGDVIGTPQYMPPEQALGFIDSIGPASDQYSLGVILQELATLRPARSHASRAQAMKQAIANSLERPVDVDGRSIHPALAAIVARATKREPGDRYPTMRALADDLRHFVRDEPVSVFREGPARRLVRAAARRPVLAIALLSFCGFLASVLVVAALVRDAQQTARRARELENMRRALVAVTSRAHKLDVDAGDLTADVKVIAAAAIELFDRNPSDFDYTARPMPPLSPHESYGGAAVSFEGIVVTWPGKEPSAELPASAAKLARLEPWLRDTVVDSLPQADRRGPISAQNAALVAGRGAVLRAFVGLEDGSFVQFPAREVSADPRKRPWYAMSSHDPSLHWTRPVVDVAKRTVRISALMGMRYKGAFLGVAGCDVRVSALANKLALELPGFRRAYLVTEEGEIAVSDTLEVSMLASATNPDEALDLPRLPDRALATRIAGSERGGYVESGDRLLVFAKLVSPPWTYVAELDRARYLER